MAHDHTDRPQAVHTLLDLRKQYGMSLRELAAKSGVSDSQISKIERGVCAPRPKSLCAIAQALGVTPEAILQEGAA